MIFDSFRSEWIKLRRWTMLFGTYGGLALAASFFSIIVFTQAPKFKEGTGGLPSLAQLAEPNGLIHGLSTAVVLLGIVAFGIAASQIATEYSLGTLRQLLVRQPRRVVMLAGKYLGVVSFVVAAVVAAAVVTGVVSVGMAHFRHVPVGAWFSGTGIKDLIVALGQLVLSVVGFATLGMAVGLFLRSSVFAVIVGFAYLVPFENVLGRVFPAVSKWLPGQALNAVGQGGNATSSLGRALITSAVYLVIAGVVTAYVFTRRDVTA
jgi:ABC-type transport system involved in multi-copper enzyme maturation permease subunit